MNPQVLLCILVAILEGVDLQAAGVAAPKLGPALHLSPADLSWFFSVSTFGLMVGAAIGGRLSDRFGRKVGLVASVGLFGALSIATGVSDTVNQLVIARFLTGVGLGGALPNVLALVTESVRPERRRAAIGLAYAGLPTGGALASLVSFFGSDPSGWRTIFYIGGLLPLLAVIPLAVFLPRLPVPAKTGEEGGYARAVFGGGRAVSSILLWIGFFLALLAMYLLLSWLPSLLIGRGLPRPDAALVQVAFNLFGAMGSAATGWLMDRSGRRGPLVAAVFASSAVAVVLAASLPVSLAISLCVGAVVGATVSGVQAVLYGTAPTLYPTAVRGTGVGVAVAAGRLGSAAGPLLAGQLLIIGLTPAQVLLSLVPILVLSGVATLFLMPRPVSGDGMTVGA
jgi:AAHS family 3-hydroxyphenylpropionic acid transporter